jgi:hypothetical protein
MVIAIASQEKITLAKGEVKFMARHLSVCNSLIKKISRHFPGGGKLK